MGLFGKKKEEKQKVKAISIITICGNGLGSSLMLAQNIKKFCSESGIEGINVEAKDFSSAKQINADFYVSVEEFTSQLDVDPDKIITVSNYHKKSDLENTDLINKINSIRN